MWGRFLRIVAVIACAQALVMLMIQLSGMPEGLSENIISVVMLFALTSPFIYKSVKRGEELREAHRKLDDKVYERTRRLKEANEQLSVWAVELEQHNNDFSLLIQFGDLLQGCNTIEEAGVIIRRSAPQIFPESSGTLYLFNEARTGFSAETLWGSGPRGRDEFKPEDCWSIRIGQTNTFAGTPDSLSCAHAAEGAGNYICVPVIASGETLGVLHIVYPSDGLERMEAKTRLAMSVAEHIGLSVQNLRLSRSLLELSIKDPLTGLYNRRHMDASLEREISRARRKDLSIGVIMLDIDHFKRFNDTLGHEAGDALLRGLGKYLLGKVRASDIPCRYGGEEFLLILPEATLDISIKRAEQICEEVKGLEVEYKGSPLERVTVSLGVSAWPVSGETQEEVISAADRALYQAKADGRDRVRVAEDAFARKGGGGHVL